MKLSEMKALLAQNGIQLTKSLGQNFLHDGNQLARIVTAGAVTPDDKVLEIGPGLGPLTERLLDSAGEVFALEKDERLVQQLARRLGKRQDGARFTLLHADALEFLKSNPRDWAGWKMISNLPYSVASPVLVELASANRPPELMIATLQLEVVQRIAAEPGTESYGILTALLQFWFEPRGWFRIPGSCFFPPPDVDSACVTLVRRDSPLLAPEQQATYARVVKTSFSQRRKKMLKLLKANWPEDKLLRGFGAAGIDVDARAETLWPRQFAHLAGILGEPR